MIFLAKQTVARILVAATRNRQALDRINRLGCLEDLGLYFYICTSSGLTDLSQMKTQARFKVKLMDKAVVTNGEAMAGFKYSLQKGYFMITFALVLSFPYLPLLFSLNMVMMKTTKDSPSQRYIRVQIEKAKSEILEVREYNCLNCELYSCHPFYLKLSLSMPQIIIFPGNIVHFLSYCHISSSAL